MNMKQRLYFYRMYRWQFMVERWRIYVEDKSRPGKLLYEIRRKGETKAKDFAADPFCVLENDVPYLFYETTMATGKGVLGCSHLVGRSWVEDGIVLEEPWHLSYPQVLKLSGQWYMIPETHEADGVFLYSTDSFPKGWHKHQQLLKGDYADATFYQKDGICYLFAYNRANGGALELWYAPQISGPWQQHCCGIITKSARLFRPAGWCYEENGQLYRVAQDCHGDYGKRIFRVPILDLSPVSYREGLAELLMTPARGEFGRHTYGEFEMTGQTWVIYDAKRFYYLPFITCLVNFIKFVGRKVFK